MKLSLIQTIDGDRFVRCAVIWSTDKQLTVKCIEPDHFDPAAGCHRARNFMSGHWRLNREDTEAIEGEFDTATLIDDMVRAQGEHMAGEHNPQIKAIIGRFETLADRLLTLGDAHPGIQGGGDPVSYLREFVQPPPNRFQYVVPKWLSVALGGTCEDRLNGAGLKMWLRVYFSGGIFTPEVSIGGDQQRYYPDFVAAVREVLRELDLLAVR